MVKSIFSRVMWVGKGTVFVVGLAVMLAVVLGAASAAFGANGQPWILGRANVATAVTTLGGALGVDGPMLRLTNNNAGTNDTALELRVQSGEAPMRVNSDARVNKLNADKLDGKHSTEIGVNGLQRVEGSSPIDSASPKFARADCPPGKGVVGNGYIINDGASGNPPNREIDVVLGEMTPHETFVFAQAYEEEPTSDTWSVTVYAICATAP